MKLNFNKIKGFIKSTLNLTNDVDITAAVEDIRSAIPFRGPNVYSVCGNHHSQRGT